MCDVMQRRLPNNAAVDFESGCYNAMFAEVVGKCNAFGIVDDASATYNMQASPEPLAKSRRTFAPTSISAPKSQRSSAARDRLLIVEKQRLLNLCDPPTHPPD